MTKSRREQQLDKTRRVEWAYYALAFVIGLSASVFHLTPRTLTMLMLPLFLLGFPLWLWQYRALDELGRLRFIKSWAFSGIVTSLGLSLVLAWETFKLDKPQQVQISLDTILIILILSAASASLSNVYLRKQEERGE